MFIIISNRQGDLIAARALAHWKSQKDREDITDKEMHDVLNSDVYKDAGGPLANSLLIRHNRVSRFVPFLPLLREHVEECTKAAMKSKGLGGRYNRYLRNQIIKEVADQHEYEPPEFQLFSSSGCMRVETELQLILGKYEDDDD